MKGASIYIYLYIYQSVYQKALGLLLYHSLSLSISKTRERPIMDKISKYNVVHRYEKRALLVAINCVGSLAIFFFGYDQGMMGSVNVSIDYAVYVMKFGHVEPNTLQVAVDNTLLQGGIVSGSSGLRSIVSMYYGRGDRNSSLTG